MESSKILPSHPMTIPTLLMLLESHSLSIKTPIKLPHKVLHKSIIIVVTVVVIQPFNNQTIKELPPTVQSFDPKSDLDYKSPNVFNPPPQLPFISCEFYGNDACYGHYCTPQVLFVYPEPCYNQDFNFLQEFQGFHNFQQQDLCCENNGVTYEGYQCQPRNLDYYHEQNSCYDSNSFGFDPFQPQQYSVNHPVFNIQNELFDSQNKLMEQLTSMYDMIPACYDDDDDYNFAITPNEPVNSLSMGDEHLDTVPATESDEFIESSVENLVLILSEFKGESKYDVPAREEFTTFSNVLFNAEYEFDSKDDQSFFNEDNLCLPMILRSLFHRRLILFSMSSPVNSLFSNQFRRELIKLIVIPRKKFVLSRDCCTITHLLIHRKNLFLKILMLKLNLSPSPIPIEDSDSLMEEIDLSFTSDYSMPPSIEDDDYNSEREILISEDLPRNDTLSLPTKESFHFDIPSFCRPPAKPPDGNIGILNVKMMDDISDQNVPMPKLMITLASNQEKSLGLLSHQGLQAFLHSATCPMMIHGKNNHLLDYSQKCEDSCQRILYSSLHFLSINWESRNLKVLETKGPYVPILVSMRCQKPGHLAARLGCAETKVATWDDLAFKLITLG
nr:hypothetical protein [Tanacetum cinerariifolium]